MEQVKDLKISTLMRYRRSPLMEVDEDDGTLIYLHRNSCPSYCDFACNGNRGSEIVERVVEVLGHE